MKKLKLNYKIINCLLILMLPIISFSASSHDFITANSNGAIISFTNLAAYFIAKISEGMQNMLKLAMPLLAGIMSINFIIGLIKEDDRSIIHLTGNYIIPKIFHYGIIIFLLNNWFTGLNISNTLITFAVEVIPEIIVGDISSIDDMVIKIMLHVTENITNLGALPIDLMKKLDVLGLGLFFLSFNMFVWCVITMLFSLFLVVGELLVEIVNIIISLTFGVLFLMFSLVSGFEKYLIHSIILLFSSTIKYSALLLIYSVIWDASKELVLQGKIESTGFGFEGVINFVMSAGIMMMTALIFKALSRTLSQTLKSI